MAAQLKKGDGHQTTAASSEEELLKVIQASVPESTHAERQWFLVDCNGNQTAAINKLRNYINWRVEHCDDALREELDSWTYATQMLQKRSAKNSSNTHSTITTALHLH